MNETITEIAEKQTITILELQKQLAAVTSERDRLLARVATLEIMSASSRSLAARCDELDDANAAGSAAFEKLREELAAITAERGKD